ncbi:hypothetical protein ACIQGZ_17200 [Streptomyces sp. NPDC092296]|uniref:hypothetical protein n=1 Tax=Streptomyces sp. NPDC092296 TaxID=3366012 RepID=UPI0038208490
MPEYVFPAHLLDLQRQLHAVRAELRAAAADPETWAERYEELMARERDLGARIRADEYWETAGSSTAARFALAEQARGDG